MNVKLMSELNRLLYKNAIYNSKMISQMARFSDFKGQKDLHNNIKHRKHTLYVCYLNMKIFLAYYVKHSYLYFHYLKSFYSQVLTPLCKAW